MDSTTGDSITTDTGLIFDTVKIPCSFAKATEGDRVFHFTQGPFHYNADLMVKLVAKLEPHIKPCIAEMLEVTLMIGGAICPMIIPSPIALLSYPLAFTEMDATFSVPISDPEVCNIEPGSGSVEALETVDVEWNTSWGAPDSCDCRAEIKYHVRITDSLEWGPWILIADTLNTGSVEWIVPALLWHEGQIRVLFKDADDESLAFDIGGVFSISFPDTASVPAKEELPAEFALMPPYPNPFTGGVTIEFGLPSASFVEVAVYDARGRLVRKILSDAMPPGYRVVSWDGDNNLGRKAGAGVYFIVVDAGGERLTRKIELLR